MPMRVRKDNFLRKLTVTSAFLLGIANLSVPLVAEAAWIRGGVKLNLRTGPGTEYRILGLLETGDEVAILSEQGDWTEIQVTADGKQGFILAGYADLEPPSAIKVLELESQVKELISQLRKSQSASKGFGEKAHVLEKSEEELRNKISLLTVENHSLKSPSRWPEWITGALILSSGMVLGGILRSILSRSKRQHRIKL